MSHERITIAMLGHTRAGKTTYMASMYGALQEPVSGFTLRAPATTEHDRLIESAKHIQKGSYPPPSDQRERYDFQLRHHGRVVCDFTWIDHRGGAIHERSNSSAQAAQLLRDLSGVDAILVFCDSAALANGEDETIGLDRLCNLVARSVSLAETPKSVVLLLSKADLIYGFDAEMLDPFSGLFASIGTSNKVDGAIAPVACGFTPRNVEKPIFYALKTIIGRRANAAREQAKQHREREQHWKAESERRWWGPVVDWFDGLITDAQAAEYAAERAREAEREAESIASDASLLQRHLSGISLISRKRTIADYIANLNPEAGPPSLTNSHALTEWR